MNEGLKKALHCAIILLLAGTVLLVCLFIFVYFNHDRIVQQYVKPELESALKTKLGAEFNAEDIKISFGSISLEDFALKLEDKISLSAKELVITYSLFSLKKARLSNIKLIEPLVELDLSDESLSKQTKVSSTNSNSKHGVPLISQGLEIVDGQITIRNKDNLLELKKANAVAELDNDLIELELSTSLKHQLTRETDLKVNLTTDFREDVILEAFVENTSPEISFNASYRDSKLLLQNVSVHFPCNDFSRLTSILEEAVLDKFNLLCGGEIRASLDAQLSKDQASFEINELVIKNSDLSTPNRNFRASKADISLRADFQRTKSETNATLKGNMRASNLYLESYYEQAGEAGLDFEISLEQTKSGLRLKAQNLVFDSPSGRFELSDINIPYSTRK